SAVGSFPLGCVSHPATFTYQLFTTYDCSRSHSDQVVNVAADGSVPDASAQTLGAGSYSYLAVYSGNSNYTAKTAACEPFKVSQRSEERRVGIEDSQGATADNAKQDAQGKASDET